LVYFVDKLFSSLDATIPFTKNNITMHLCSVLYNTFLFVCAHCNFARFWWTLQYL